MAEAIKDSNRVPVMMGVLNTNGTTPMLVYGTSNHFILLSDNTTGSDNGPSNAVRDNNSYPTLMAVSSSDGLSTVNLYVDSSHNLLVDST